MSNYHLYQSNPTPLSSERIFDFYLFVNPLGKQCYHCEKEVLQFIEQSSDKVHVYFIAFHNFQAVTQYMRYMHLNEKDIDLRNDACMKIYDAALSYKAALLQGKKLGHAFLMELQSQLHQHQKDYSLDLLHEIIEKVGLDKKMFFEDKSSELVRRECEKDQQIAQEMLVEQTPSLVIFDNMNQHYGVLIKEYISADTISEICNQQSFPAPPHYKQQSNCALNTSASSLLKIIQY